MKLSASAPWVSGTDGPRCGSAPGAGSVTGTGSARSLGLVMVPVPLILVVPLPLDVTTLYLVNASDGD